jgi:hypothetical protein
MTAYEICDTAANAKQLQAAIDRFDLGLIVLRHGKKGWALTDRGNVIATGDWSYIRRRVAKTAEYA